MAPAALRSRQEVDEETFPVGGEEVQRLEMIFFFYQPFGCFCAMTHKKTNHPAPPSIRLTFTHSLFHALTHSLFHALTHSPIHSYIAKTF